MLRFVSHPPKALLAAVLGCVAILALALICRAGKKIRTERDSDFQLQIASFAEDQPVAPYTYHHELSAGRERTPEVEMLHSTSSRAEERPVAVSRTAAAATVPADPGEKWLKITIGSGDNLTVIFKKAGLGAKAIYPLLKSIKSRKVLDRLMPGQCLYFMIKDGKLQKLRLERSPLLSILISRTGQGYSLKEVRRTPEVLEIEKQGTIDQSLFLAARDAGLSPAKIMELAGIFAWDIDFALDIRKGDSFGVIYQRLVLDGKVIKDGPIVAAEFINQGKVYRAVRYTDSAGRSNYYTPAGGSMRKAFLRSPVDYTRISSRYNPHRKHPVFKTSRPHRGVDYAAPAGTPIRSSGDGKIIFAGFMDSYGKVVIIRHGQKYSTLYAHMSRIKHGIERGVQVNQGQVIGKVGSTGHATGPHLHYEFRVNGIHRNPLTVPLPRARSIAKKERAKFDPLAYEMLARLDMQDTRMVDRAQMYFLSRNSTPGVSSWHPPMPRPEDRPWRKGSSPGSLCYPARMQGIPELFTICA